MTVVPFSLKSERTVRVSFHELVFPMLIDDLDAFSLSLSLSQRIEYGSGLIKIM